MLRKSSKALLAVVMIFMIVLSASMSAFAAVPDSPTLPNRGSVSSFGNQKVVANSSIHDSPSFVLRANATVKLKVNIVSNSGSGSLYYQIVNSSGTSVASGTFSSSGTKTHTISSGGTYHVHFYNYSGRIVFNYTITF